MTEPFDVHADSFNIRISAWGIILGFNSRKSGPAAVDVDQPEAEVREGLGTAIEQDDEFHGSIRMSIELMKVFQFVVSRQIRAFEEMENVKYPVPESTLNSLSISKEEWGSFWS